MDNTPPVITCAQDVIRQIACDQNSAQVNFLATATDNCGAATVSYSSQGATTFFDQFQGNAVMNVGFSTVTATATDTNGRTASCSMQVSISAGINSVLKFVYSIILFPVVL